MNDIQSRTEIQVLVDAFYVKVQQDGLLGPIFGDVAKVDWPHHLPHMYDFWQTVLFRNWGYQGSPITVHAMLAQKTVMGREQFSRWLLLFKQTVDELFSGPNAEHIKNCAADMANVLHRKVNQLHDHDTLDRPGGAA